MACSKLACHAVCVSTRGRGCVNTCLRERRSRTCIHKESCCQAHTLRHTVYLGTLALIVGSKGSRVVACPKFSRRRILSYSIGWLVRFAVCILRTAVTSGSVYCKGPREWAPEHKVWIPAATLQGESPPQPSQNSYSFSESLVISKPSELRIAERIERCTEN